MAEDRAQRAVDVAGLGLDRPAGLGLEHATEAAADDFMVVDEDEPDGVALGHLPQSSRFSPAGEGPMT